MPSSLIIVALVVAWLVVLVPMVARKRRGVEEGYDLMPEADDFDHDPDFDDDFDEFEDRPYRQGRGGYDPETAAVIAQARYAFRRRVVAFLLLASLATGLVAGFLYPIVWWGHAGVDLLLVGYLTYLRRQVRIEEEIRARRQARLQQMRRRRAAPRPRVAVAAPVVEEVVVAEPEPVLEEEVASVLPPQPRFEHFVRPGTIPVDADDEDPMFVELDGPEKLPYRGAVGA